MKTLQKRKLQAIISDIDAKNPLQQKILVNGIQQYSKKKKNPLEQDQAGFQGCKDGFNILKSINGIHHINKDKNHIYDLNKCRDAFDKIQHLLMKNNFSGKFRGTYLNITKAIYEKPTDNIILNGENANTPEHTPYFCILWL